MWSVGCATLLILFCAQFRMFTALEDRYSCSTFEDYATNRHMNPKCTYNPNIGDSVPNIIERHGYKPNIFETVTEDGYILSIIRICAAKRPTKGVIFIQHPYSIGSIVWVDKGNKSLAFNLADMGYDVWLGNSRGTKLSPKHVRLTWRRAKYWDYSFHEIAVYDYPAMLKLVKNVTNAKITFIGYSAAGTSALIYASVLKPIAKDTVDLFVTISPTFTLGKLLTILAPWIYEASTLLGESNIQDIFALGAKAGLRYFPTLLPLLFENVAGITREKLHPPFVALFLNAMPDGLNTKQANHYAQITTAKRFRGYDHGRAKNKLVYGKEDPPEYPLRDIEIPFHIIYGSEDTFFGALDAQLLYEKLPVSVRYQQPYNIGSFNHMDFGYGKNVDKLNKHIADLLKNRN